MRIDKKAAVRQALMQMTPAGLSAEALSQLRAQTGASNDEIRAVVDELTAAGQFVAGADERRALERLLSIEDSRSFKAPPTKGPKVVDIRAAKHRPWFAAVKDPPALGTPLFQEPARDVEILGERISKDELRAMLRRLT